MKKIEFNFVITGLSKNAGPFEEKGEGVMKINESDFSIEGALQSEMVKEALDTFIAVTQPSKKYENISELTVTVRDIVEL